MDPETRRSGPPARRRHERRGSGTARPARCGIVRAALRFSKWTARVSWIVRRRARADPLDERPPERLPDAVPVTHRWNSWRTGSLTPGLAPDLVSPCGVGSRCAGVSESLLIAGVVCIVASIVGGGIKLLGAEVPVLNSFARQVMLFTVGAGFLLASFWVGERKFGAPSLAPPAQTSAQTPASALLSPPLATTSVPSPQAPATKAASSAPDRPRASIAEACEPQTWGEQTLTSGEARDYSFSMENSGRVQVIVSEIRPDWSNFSSSEADHPGIPEVYIRLCNSSNQNDCGGVQLANAIPYQKKLGAGPGRVQITHFKDNPEPISYTLSVSCL
jgi:hypothetical protein